MDKPPEKDKAEPEAGAETKAAEKDRDFRLVCQRYARMRAPSRR